MIESLDVRTLVVVLVLGHAIAALLLFVDTQKRAQDYDLLFMTGMALQAAAWLLIILRGTVPDFLSFGIGNSLIFAGFCLEGVSLLALVCPVGKQWHLFYASVLAVILAFWWFPGIPQGTEMGINAFLVPLFFIFPAVFLVFSAPRPTLLQKFIGITVLLYIAATLFRGAYILYAGSYSLTIPSFYQVLFLLIQILAMILVSTGYILIRREFANEELEKELNRRTLTEAALAEESHNLGKRVKEIRCLYEVTRLIETFSSPEVLLPAMADALPAGWQYPELTCARIEVDGREYRSGNFKAGSSRQEAEIVVRGLHAGTIEVCFLGDEAEYGKAPFLREEADLLGAVAERIGRMLERQRAEEARRESEEKYRKLFDQSNDAIFIADALTRRLVDCNRKAGEMTGYSRTALLAMTADEIHPEDVRARTMERFRAFLEGKTSSIETEVLTRHGKRVPVSINAGPVEIAGQQLIMGVFRDITWQKEVEKAIREKTEEVDQYFTASLDLFCIADTDGYFRRLNPEWEKTLGYTLAELEGKRFLDFVHPDDLQATLVTVGDLRAQQEVINFVNRYRHRDGTYRWIEWRSLPKGDRIFAAARDVTRRYIEEHYSSGLSRLKEELLITAPLEEKLKKITDACVTIFSADFARIWITGSGDLCEKGCIHAAVTEGPNACRDRSACLHLIVSSGRYTHTDGGHRRVPFGAYKIGRIASGEDARFVTNDVTHDPRVHDHAWAASLCLVSFSGFQLLSAEGKPTGVLAFFSRQPVTPEMTPFLDDLATTTSQVILTGTAEAALRESEEQFRRLISRSFDAVVVHQDGRIVVANDAAVQFMGASGPGDLVGRPMMDLVHPDYRRIVAGRVREMLGSPEGTVPLMEEKFIRFDGTPITLAVMATSTRHEGRPAVIVVFRDITKQKQAEEEVFRSRQMLQLVIDTIPQRVFWKDRNSVYLGCNLPLAKDAGYASPEELIGKDDFATASKATAELYRVDDRQVMETGVPKYNYEEPQVKPDGSPAWLSTSKIPLRDRSGVVIGVLGTYEDITDRKRAEEALRESEEQFRLLITSVPVPLSFANSRGEIEFSNTRFAELFGYTPGDVPTVQAWYEHAYPDPAYRKQVVATWDAAMQRAAELKTDIEPSEYRVTCRDGTVKNVLISGITIAGKLLATFIDITARREAEEALRESEEKYRTIIENMQDMFYRTDTVGSLTMITQSGVAMLGYDSADQILGRPATDLYVNADDRNDFLEALRRTGSVYGYPVVLKSRDGTPRHVTASSHFYYGADGAVLGVEGVLHDVTELRLAEDGLRMANKKLNLLSGITRHDIMNQLMALSGYIQLSSRAVGDPDALREYFRKEEQVATNISRQITFTRDYEDLGVKSPAWQDAGLLVRSAAAALALGSIRLVTDCPGLEVFADPLLEKVFYNLIDNSLRYGGATMTTLLLTMQQQGEELRIIYTDDGGGISAEEKKRLFKKGFGKNTGLGLFLSREILDITGITITENGEPGKGARFVITVPKGAWRLSGKK